MEMSSNEQHIDDYLTSMKIQKLSPMTILSKFVIMSDCHRGSGKTLEIIFWLKIYFAALNDYYKKGFTYIELGDGDELWEK